MPAPGMGATGGGIPTADGRSIELSSSDSTGRSLAQILKAGTTISGRVVERFPGDTYLINIRGQNIIAESSAPLLRDSIVRLQVLATLASEGGLRLRIADGASGDSATTSLASQRLQALGLGDSATARLTLAAFEEIGAALSPPTRIQQAQNSVAALAQGGASLAQQLQSAAAHALLAQARLPVTPAMLQLAERALQGQMSQASQSLVNVQQLLTVAGKTAGNVGNAFAPLPTPTAAGQVGTMASALPTQAGAGPAAPLFQTAVALPTTVTMPSGASGGQAPSTAATSHVLPTPGKPLSGTAAGPANTPALANPATSNPHSAPITSPPSAPVVANPAAQGAGGSLPLPFAALSPQPSASPAASLQYLLHLHDLSRSPQQALRNALHGLGIQVSANEPLPSANPNPPATQLNPAPSLAHGRLQAEAVRGNAAPEIALGSLLKQVAEIAQQVSSENPGLRAASGALVREMLGESILPPRTLNDYDMVLPFPLFDQQQAVPARLALSQRRQGSTEATFLRIDVELSQLGPLSLRFTEMSGSPLSISIFHTAKAGPLLRQGMEDLHNDLRSHDIETTIRLRDYSHER